MAAAAFRRPIAELVIAKGADCRAKNRRGAEPLHYAADANHWSPMAQAEVIEYLASVGADQTHWMAQGWRRCTDPSERDRSQRYEALVEAGANPRQPNKARSRPLHPAVQSTGRAGSGSQQARQQQADIIRLLLECGARPTDKDCRGTPVYQAATSEWIRTLLEAG